MEPNAGTATTTPGPVYAGCASSYLPRDTWHHLPLEGRHLQRYAGRLNAAEINTSFHRPHQVQTYARWAGAVAHGFRFSLKVWCMFHNTASGAAPGNAVTLSQHLNIAPLTPAAP
ncbi:MAG: DUF72 domain-containing protein [Bdellovibrionales bacterium]|nr:DUF72 domain-containing protein [Ramlibacter sp.]